MPNNNLGAIHIAQPEVDRFDEQLNNMLALLMEITGDGLSPEERQRYGSINEKNKGVANAVQDFSATQPDLRSPDVNWVEFEADYSDRKFADTRADKVDTVKRLLTDFKIKHDYDNYRAARIDYDYTEYRANAGDSRFIEKYEHLKQFFAKDSVSNPPA